MVVERETQYLAKALRSQTLSSPRELMEAMEIVGLGIRRLIREDEEMSIRPEASRSPAAR